MREVVSTHKDFPRAIETPWALSRRLMAEWLNSSGLLFNHDYIYVFSDAIGTRDTVSAIAFKDPAIALLFKMSFAGTF